ncbi:CRP-like cAMP-binding protein [Sphingomonas aerolata]|uniref:CRP-like cAMP-binding protein n=1 Tax=Sphingomonas aerolata TaxID=185951 RepID=A0A2T4YS57_9SPHN|nr:CRP-like cAMP-binding protein [Sphingomonas aerolata]
MTSVLSEHRPGSTSGPRTSFSTRSPAADKLVRKLRDRHPLSAAEEVALNTLLAAKAGPISGRTVLLDRGMQPSGIHVLLDGWACRYTMLVDGRRRIVAFYLPGDVCDFDVFLLAGMDQTIAAITPARVAVVDAPMLAGLAIDHPPLTQALWWESLTAAAIQRAWTLNVGQRSAKQRIAHLLCELYLRMDRVGLVQDGSCALPLTQFHLGDACALTSIHTNRALQELRRDGLLSLEARRLTIHDWPALVDLAAFDPAYLQLSKEPGTSGDSAALG